MGFKAYAAHEQASAGALMFIKMVFFSLLFGMAIFYGAYVLGFNLIDAHFVENYGFPSGAIKTYLNNHFIRNKMSFNAGVIKWEPQIDVPEGMVGMLFAEDRVSSRFYNDVLEKKFMEIGSAKLDSARKYGLFTFITGLSLMGLFVFVYFFIFSRKSKALKDEKHLKGAKLMKKDLFIEKTKTLDGDNLSISVGDAVFPRNREAYHTLIYGSSGSGKSTLMNQLLNIILERKTKNNLNEKTIVYDVKGEYCAKHFSPERGDIIFFPFDKRSVKWSLFNEVLAIDEEGEVVLDYSMLDVVCTILCSPSTNKDSKNDYFYSAAADVLRAILQVLYARKKMTNSDIADFMGKTREQMISEFKAILPAKDLTVLEHISAADQASGVLGVFKNQLKFIRYLIGQDGDFCLRKFIEKESQSNLFLMNLPRLSEVFRPLMTFSIDLMIRHTLSLPDSKDRRVQFFVDELGSLAKIDSMFRFLTLSRSKGGCLYASNQEEGAIKEIYGEKLLESFNNNFGTLLVFRQNDEKSAQSMSKQLGEHEVIKRQESHSFSPSSMGDRLQVGDQQKRETLITYSEIQHLEDLKYYYKLSGVGISKFSVPRVFLPEINPHIIERVFTDKSLREKGEAFNAQEEEDHKAFLSYAAPTEPSPQVATDAPSDESGEDVLTNINV